MSGVATALAGIVAAAPTPPSGDVELTPTGTGSPGFLGFVVTFLLAVAVIGLFLSLTKQLRVVDRRAKQLGLDDSTQDAQAVAGGAPDGADGAPGATTPGGGATTPGGGASTPDGGTAPGAGTAADGAAGPAAPHGDRTGRGDAAPHDGTR